MPEPYKKIALPLGVVTLALLVGALFWRPAILTSRGAIQEIKQTEMTFETTKLRKYEGKMAVAREVVKEHPAAHQVVHLANNRESARTEGLLNMVELALGDNRKQYLFFPGDINYVDPATGEAVRYGLDETPAWIDRVYSAHTVRDMVNWWGNYADSNWKLIGRTKANRFQVVGDPVLVYTKGGHPDWQVVISSLNDDNSITGVMLVNGRTGKARLFPSLAGTPIPEDVLHTFQNARDTIKNFRPRHLSMHLIFGEPTWVVSYITPAHDGDDTPGEPFQGIGLLPARDVNGSNVVFAKTKEAAFAQYLTVLAHQSSTDAPSEKRAVEETSGTVREVVQQIEEGNTFYLIWLNEDAAHVFRAARNVSVELPFVKPGDTVTVQYIDVGEVVVNVARFNDLAVPFVP